MAKFFVTPFAISGNRTIIPEAAQPSGEVSYTTGFTLDYSLDPDLNPNAKEVPRDKSNEIYYEITLALQQYQTHGSPSFITTIDNLGIPYPYGYNAIVNYNDGVNGIRLYRSLINNNTDLPTVISSWQILPFFINGTATGTANTLTLNTSSVYQNFVFGDSVQLKISSTNTGPSTLQVGSTIPIEIRKNDLSQLSGNEMISGSICDFIFDGNFFILTNNVTSQNSFANKYAQVAFNSLSSQTIPPMAQTKVEFDNVLHNLNGFWDSANYRFIPNFPGFFEVTATVSVKILTGFVGLDHFFMGVFKNGSLLRYLDSRDLGTDDGDYNAIVSGSSGTFSANGTSDYIEIFISNSSVQGLSLGYSPSLFDGSKNLFEIRYLGS